MPVLVYTYLVHIRRDERSIGATDLKLETTVGISMIANASGDVMDAKRITASMHALVQTQLCSLFVT